MKIVGCDLHARQQSIAMMDTETGEFTEKLLKHGGNAVREFYAPLEGPVVVGIEATGRLPVRCAAVAFASSPIGVRRSRCSVDGIQMSGKRTTATIELGKWTAQSREACGFVRKTSQEKDYSQPIASPRE